MYHHMNNSVYYYLYVPSPLQATFNDYEQI